MKGEISVKNILLKYNVDSAKDALSRSLIDLYVTEDKRPYYRNIAYEELDKFQEEQLKITAS